MLLLSISNYMPPQPDDHEEMNMKALKSIFAKNLARPSIVSLALSIWLITASANGFGQTGWAVGDKGTILYTSNGKEWKPQDAPKNFKSNLYAVASADGGKTAWAVGDGSAILYYDGKWHDKSVITVRAEFPALRSLFFADATHGWAVGDSGEIVRYDGKNWWAQSPVTSKRLRSVYFVKFRNGGRDQYYGWAVGDDNGTNGPTILVSTDGAGEKWDELKDNRPPVEKADATGIAFVAIPRNGAIPRMIGWMVGDKKVLIWKSRNAGVNWKSDLDPKKTARPGLSAVQALSQNDIWAVGSGYSSVIRWDPVKEKWVPRNGGVQDLLLSSLSFLDPNTGWVAGATPETHRGIISFTKNGGMGFKTQFRGDEKTPLNGIAMFPAGNRQNISLESLSSPDTGTAGVTYVSLVGIGFGEGDVNAANVDIQMADECQGGTSATTSAVSIVSGSGDSKLLSFLLPAGLEPGQYFVSISDSEEGDANFESTNCAVVNVQ